MSNILIRVDASPRIGIGHFMRCIALGQALQDNNHNVTFISKSNNAFLLEKINREKFDFIRMDPKYDLLEDIDNTINSASKIKSNSIITDGYQFNTEYHQVLKNAGFFLVSIDDLAQNHFVSDIVLNQNIGAENIFEYSCEPYTELLLGIKYVLLRREFRETNGWERKCNEQCNNILLTMGGSDENNTTSKILRIFERFDTRKLQITVVLGPGFVHKASIDEIAKNSFHSIKICVHVENMVPIIKNTDLAISAPGSTVWELLKLGTPSVLIKTAENQIFVFEELSKIGACLCLGRIDEISEEYIELQVFNLINNFDMRKHLMKKSIEMSELLGNGLEKIIHKVKGI